jgi:hypothetical protein
MKAEIADIIALVEFFPTEAGGRQSSTLDEKFHCLMTLDGESFDVRLNVRDTGPISPGQTLLVPIKFLDSQRAITHCSVGKHFILRELRPIAKGVMEVVVFPGENGI